jgi:hypothetical protein
MRRIAMQKMILMIALSVAALSLSGCGCSRPFASWFNRGGSCAPVDPCAGAPRATLFGGGQIPPGVEVTPYPTNP